MTDDWKGGKSVLGATSSQRAGYESLRTPDRLRVIYHELRDDRRAVDYDAHALAVAAATRLPYSNLAYSLEQPEQFDSASKIIARFEHRFPDNPDLHQLQSTT